MIKITEKFKGEDKYHIVLNPTDIDSILTILKFSKNALNGVAPWDNKSQWPTYIRVIEWMESGINEARR